MIGKFSDLCKRADPCMRANRKREVHTELDDYSICRRKHSLSNSSAYLEYKKCHWAKKTNRPYNCSNGFLIFDKYMIETMHCHPFGKIKNTHFNLSLKKMVKLKVEKWFSHHHMWQLNSRISIFLLSPRQNQWFGSYKLIMNPSKFDFADFSFFFNFWLFSLV